MEMIRKEEIVVLQNPGVDSHQLLFPENSESRRVTVTRVVIVSGATTPRHRHESSEQIWVALSGQGTLLLDEDQELSFSAGDVVRFADGDVHGLRNPGPDDFIYLAVTSPPLNFRDAYQQQSP